MVTVGVNLQEISIDPFSNGNFQHLTIADLVFEPLVYIDGSLNTVGSLVEGWEINKAGDRYKFKLKQNIKFHDGKTFNADDVIWTFKKHLAVDSKSFEKATLKEILYEKNGSFEGSLVAIDPYTVEFHLKGAYPPFLEYLAGIYITPKHFDPANPIGCGPFAVSKLTKSEVVLKRVPSHGFLKTNLQDVKFVIVQTDEFQKNLTSKALDLTLQAPLDLALHPPKGYSVFTSEYDLVSVVFYFNFRRKVYENTHVRQFIREKLYNARKKQGFLTKFDRSIEHLIPFGMMPPEYYTTRESKNLKKPANFPHKLKILAPNTFLTDTAINTIKDIFNSEGVEVEFFLGKGKQLHEPAIKGDFDLALLPYEGMVRDPDAFMFLITPEAPIVSFFNLPTENDIRELHKVKFEGNKEKRLKNYSEIIRRIEENDIIVPIFGQNMPFLYSEKLIPPKSHLMTLVSLRFFNKKDE